MYEDVIAALSHASKHDSIRVVVLLPPFAIRLCYKVSIVCSYQLLTGAGDYFSSGNDLSNFLKSDPSNLQETLGKGKGMATALTLREHIHNYSSAHNVPSVDLLNRFVSAFIHFPKPIVAAVNGPAVGTTNINYHTPALSALILK